MKICEVVVLSVSHLPPERVSPSQTHIVESSNGPVKIPHRGFECELLPVNLNTSHVELVPSRITVLIAVKDGKGHFGSILIGEETSDITEQDGVVSVAPKRVV